MLETHHNPVGDRCSETKSKVAIVCHSHPSVTKGGAEIAAYALFRGLRQIGVDAIFIAACEHANRHRLAFADANEFAIFYDGTRFDHFYQLAPRTTEQQLVQILREQRVEVVNFHHFLHLGVNSLRAVAQMPGIRTYLTIHEYLAICHNHGQMITRPGQSLCSQSSNDACINCFPEFLRSQFAMRTETIFDAFSRLDGFISPSHFLAERYVNWGLPRERISIIENGLSGSPTPLQQRKRRSVWTFGYFGQINPFKGVDIILGAAELIAADPELANSMRVRIHGNFVGQSQSAVEQFNQALKDFRFLSYAGTYDGSSVYKLMSECDYVVVPSKWWENSPVVIQEAYAVRTPVICSGLGGMAEKVKDGISGLHFNVADSADLVRVMKTATDPAVAATLRAGVPAVSSAAEMAQRYARLFGIPGSSDKAGTLAHDRAG